MAEEVYLHNIARRHFESETWLTKSVVKCLLESSFRKQRSVKERVA